jgi:hypothetical protein
MPDRVPFELSSTYNKIFKVSSQRIKRKSVILPPRDYSKCSLPLAFEIFFSNFRRNFLIEIHISDSVVAYECVPSLHLNMRFLITSPELQECARDVSKINLCSWILSGTLNICEIIIPKDRSPTSSV